MSVSVYYSNFNVLITDFIVVKLVKLFLCMHIITTTTTTTTCVINPVYRICVISRIFHLLHDNMLLLFESQILLLTLFDHLRLFKDVCCIS